MQLEDTSFLSVLGSLLRFVLALGGILGLIYLVLHKGLGTWLKKHHQGNHIQVIERVTLEPKRSLYLVKIDNRTFLVGSAEQQLSVLSELPDFKTQGLT